MRERSAHQCRRTLIVRSSVRAESKSGDDGETEPAPVVAHPPPARECGPEATGVGAERSRA